MGERQPLAQVKGLWGSNFIAFICSKYCAVLAAWVASRIMAQKYKVFIDDAPLVFSAEPLPDSIPYVDREQLLRLKRDMEKGRLSGQVLHCPQLEKAWADFRALHTLVEAAGGVVQNPSGQWLMIYRLGRWDLPKGKMEPGEKPEETACREVMEECGLRQPPQVLSALPDTYHTYHLPEGPVLKRSYWYRMRYSGQEPLQPQTEEDIHQVGWYSSAQVVEKLANTYGNIEDLLRPLL